MTYDITFTADDTAEYRRIHATLKLTDSVRDLLSDELSYEFNDLVGLIQDTEVQFNSSLNRYSVQWILEPVYKELDEVLEDATFTCESGIWEVADDPEIDVISTSSNYMGDVTVRCTLMAKPI